MATAYDFNRVPGPSADEIKQHGGEGALTYGTGEQQSPEYLAELEAAGLHCPLIWEHNTDSILGGFDYGVDECRAWEATHPAGKLVYLACDLNDGALGGRSVIPFCSGWCSTTREAGVGLYGPDDAILDGQRSGLAKLNRWWGVVNWLQGGGPDNDPGNIARWRDIGAHLIQLIGSPIPDTDENLILRSDWWTTGAAAQPSEADVEYFATDPANRAAIWWFGVAGRRWVSASEWAILQFAEVAAGRPALKPFAGTAEMFARVPDITSFVGGPGGGGSSPQRFVGTTDLHAA